MRGLLDEYGFRGTKIHLAEWHKGPESWNISQTGHAAYFASLTGDAATAGQDAGRLLLAGRDVAAKGGVQVDVKGGLVPKTVYLVGAGKLAEPVDGWTFRNGCLALTAVDAPGVVWMVDCAPYR